MALLEQDFGGNGAEAPVDGEERPPDVLRGALGRDRESWGGKRVWRERDRSSLASQTSDKTETKVSKLLMMKEV